MALRVLELVEERGALSVDDVRMRRGLQLRAGHVDVVLDDDGLHISSLTGGSTDSCGAQANRRRLALANIGADDLGTLTSQSALDVRPTQLPALHGVLGDYQRWASRSEAPPRHEDLPGTTFALLLELVESASMPTDLAERFEAHGFAAEDGASVESIGLFLLVGGRPRSAVVVLERAVAKNPKSARVHWAHAVGCWYWGWEDKASESLDRALALDPENLVLAETQRRFEGHRTDSSSHFTDVLSRARWTTTESLQLALIGVDVRSPIPEDATNQQRFADAVLHMALQASADSQTVTV